MLLPPDETISRESELKAELGRLQSALDAAEVGTWTIDLQTGVDTRDATLNRMLGLGAALSRSPFESSLAVTHPEDRAVMNEALRRAVEERGHYDVELRIVRPDGETRWIRDRGRVFCDEAGTPTHVAGAVTDITDRKRAQIALEASEERYRLATEALEGATWDTDVATGYAARSPRFAEIIGVSPEEMVPVREWWHARIHPDDLPEFHRRLKELYEGRVRRLDIEYRVHHEGGHWIWVWQRAIATLDEEGRLRRVSGAMIDITKRKQVEEALRESEKRLKATQEHAGIGIAETDATGRYLRANEAFCRITGYPQEELLRLSSWDLTHPDDVPVEAGRFAEQVRGDRGPYFVEKRFLRKDGSLGWGWLSGSAVRDDGGRFLYAVRVLQDISDRRVTEDALREREEQLRLSLAASRMGDWSWDAGADRLVLSPRAAEIFGFETNAPMTWAAFERILRPEDVERLRSTVKAAIAAGQSWDTEYAVFRPSDGAEVWVAAKGQARLDRTGRIRQTIGVVQDITERRRSQERQRLLINELNHRVKNTLATVQSIASQTLRNAGSLDRAREDFEIRLLALSRAHDVLTRENWEGARLREIVAGAIAPYRQAGEDRFRIRGPDLRLPPRIALPLAMALHELVTNAVKYGALSDAVGRVGITWTALPGTGRLVLQWRESGGPPVEPPTRRGFGSRLIERSLSRDLGGDVRIDFAPAGLVCTVDAPLESVEGTGGPALPVDERPDEPEERGAPVPEPDLPSEWEAPRAAS